MGRSAKLHKRVKKTASSASGAQAPKASVAPPAAPKAASGKRKAGLKDKAQSRKRTKEGEERGHVLGGADYVSLMMGGRRKAREEAEKLPVD